ncbi:MAG: transposase [Candidatus Buchananbacteria bacterium]|nr:transposase [Candidatus Buchananbacteria bacterium]
MFKNKSPRIYLTGCFYFVTVKTQFYQPIFTDENLVKIFGESLNFLKQRQDFKLVAGVLLPDHFHLLLKPEKKNISQIIHNLKSYTTTKISEHIFLNRRGVEASPENGMVVDFYNYRQGFHALPSYSKRKTISIKIWQRSFHYHIINSEKDFINHYNYICRNPVKHGYMSEAKNWPGLWIDDEFEFRSY